MFKTTFRLILPAMAGIVCMFCVSCSQKSQTVNWQPKTGPLMTRWSQEVQPEKTWTEYPRPQMKRNSWKNLNGVWDYAITADNKAIPATWQGTILVPYPIESALSGVMKTLQPGETLWYHRVLKISSKLKSSRILLNFEAVDWSCVVYLDGNVIGTHKGGYDPFSFEITDNIEMGKEHHLVLAVQDPSTDGYQPVGKQTNHPQGIWYTPSSGIWQTVWIETVPKAYIRNYTVVPDIDKGTITVKVYVVGLRSSDNI